MKGRLNVFFLISGLLLTMLHALFAEDLTIRIDPQQTTVGISEVCSLDVVIENVTNLGAFQFDIVYSTDVVHADTALMGPFLGSTGRTVLPVGPDIDNTSVPGRLTFGGATFGTDLGPDGSGVLATLVFISQTAGSTILELQNVQIADINGQALTIDSIIDGQMVVLPPAEIWVVTNTNDSGPGSLRWAIEQANANAGPDSIVFNIPTTDPGYDSGTGVWTIQPDSALPALTDDNTIIDGTTQTANQGDTNPNGPEIEIDGTNAGEASGFTIYAANNIIKGLVINRFTQFGIIITGSSANGNVVSGNYIGTDVSGTSDRGNTFSGVIIYTGSQDNIIGGTTAVERNIISGNDWSGVEIQGLGADNNIVIGNYIGTDITGSEDLGNSQYGVHIWSFAKGNTVGGATVEERNIISGNDWSGVGIGHSDSNRVWGNYIGTGVSGTEDLGNSHDGVSIVRSQGNTIGPNNFIANNEYSGVKIKSIETISNTITQNSITNNNSLGIDNVDGGNAELTPPIITIVTSTFISGTAPPNSTVEIFSDSTDEGAIYEGTVVADASGNFTWTGTPTGPFITATATDAGGNTSEFSTPVSSSVEDQAQVEIPGAFKLFQNYPNPFNPNTQIDFALAEFCRVSISIYNTLGQRIKILVDKYLPAGHYNIHWDGKDAYGKQVAGGVYFICMRVDGFSAFKKAVFLK